MKEELIPQYAQVMQPFGTKIPVVHCPICGHPTMNSGEVENDAVHSPCKHLAFIFIGELGDFEYKTEKFENRITNLDTEELDFSNFDNFLKQAGYGNQMLAIELTFGGMACGPVWRTEVFGFDYGTLTE